MAKKKRCKKIVVYIAREGDREEYLLNYLQEIFDPEKNIQLKYSQEKGGNSNAILDRALKNAYYPKVYAWFDEDDQLDEEHRIELAKRWNTDTLTADIMDKDLQHYNKKMRYNFVKFGITANLELNAERRDYPLFEQNREIFNQIFNFHAQVFCHTFYKSITFRVHSRAVKRIFRCCHTDKTSALFVGLSPHFSHFQ